MADTVTPDQVVDAAKALDKPEFTRADLADQLKVEKEELKEGFRAARKAGRLEKLESDGEGKPRFRLTGN
jgi:hypothetical protein